MTVVPESLAAALGNRKLPDAFAERARLLVAGRLAIEPARAAATVALLRDTSDGVEVYALRRQSTMAFAAGQYVFPGGSVDPRDTDAGLGWVGPGPAFWAAAFAAPEPAARALVCAAVRETFEESGVLLAGPDADSVVADTSGDDWEADRRALIERDLAFAEFLNRRGLAVRADLLRPWAHWITPAIEPRRFDTRFFVAAMPAGQRTREFGEEADRVEWVRPLTAIGRCADGKMQMMPPTLVTMAELGEFDSVAAALAAHRVVTPIEPRVVLDGAHATMVLPGDPAWDRGIVMPRQVGDDPAPNLL
jgi:8-oxo-dGTP pyrophosphatase MutT (NUDIX family)